MTTSTRQLIHPETAQKILQRRNELFDQGHFGVVSSVGAVAVITEFWNPRMPVNNDEATVLTRERHNMIRYFRARSRRIIDGPRATTADIRTIVRDPSVSHLCVIAHGNIGSVHVEPEPSAEGPDCITAQDISDWATHLKFGWFYLRTCAGVIGRGKGANIPWPLAMAASTENILISQAPALANNYAASLPGEQLKALLPGQTDFTVDTLNACLNRHADENNLRLVNF